MQSWPEYLKRSPPPWLRHVTPYWALAWLDHRLPVCWAKLVIWKLYGSTESWWPSITCFAAHPERYDYCSKFQDLDEDSDA